MSMNPHGGRMPRAERAARVKRLKEAGLSFNEIARYMGVSKSTVTSVYYDPTGVQDRARRERYKGRCIDCGTPTASSYKDGEKAAERCMRCRHAYERTVDYRFQRRYGSQVTWTDDDLLDAIRRVAINGEVTATMYFDAYAAADNGSMPSLIRIVQRFDTWNKAVEAAGLRTKRGAIRRERITAAGCMLAVQECAAEFGRVPSYSEYVRWAQEVGAPSGSLVRIRLGGWMPVVEALSAELGVAA